GAVVQRPIQQPPPEKAAVWIVINHYRTIVIWLKKRPDARRSCVNRVCVGHINRPCVTARRGRDGRRLGSIRIVIGHAGGTWGRGGSRILALLVFREILFAGFFLLRSGRGRIKSKTGRCRRAVVVRFRRGRRRNRFAGPVAPAAVTFARGIAL